MSATASRNLGNAYRAKTRTRRRSGRPPRGLAGEVEERILDAARQVFVAHGFAGASIDQIAAVAGAGKPTIYARFSGKEALFTAVFERHVDNINLEEYVATGATLEARLRSLGLDILQRRLTPDVIALIRLGIAEARRFPRFAVAVGRMARAHTREPVARLCMRPRRLRGVGRRAPVAAPTLRRRRNISSTWLSCP